jgi:uncharacterized BrkB/YihY/UPF0761 family membrane protein
MKGRNIALYILGSLITVCFFTLLFAMFIYRIPQENKDPLTLALGSLLSAFGMVVGYFYGSSKGSADKNDLLANNGKQLS